MKLIRWQEPDLSWPLDHLNQLRDEMNRLFQSPFSGLAENEFFNKWGPPVDLYEDKNHFIVKAEIPGMKKEEIEVSLHDGALVVSGERKKNTDFQGEEHRSERFVGSFRRSVVLPLPVSGEAVQASYKDGILTVTLPKAEEAKPKQIAVNIK